MFIRIVEDLGETGLNEKLALWEIGLKSPFLGSEGQRIFPKGPVMFLFSCHP